MPRCTRFQRLSTAAAAAAAAAAAVTTQFKERAERGTVEGREERRGEEKKSGEGEFHFMVSHHDSQAHKTV